MIYTSLVPEWYVVIIEPKEKYFQGILETKKKTKVIIMLISLDDLNEKYSSQKNYDKAIS